MPRYREFSFKQQKNSKNKILIIQIHNALGEMKFSKIHKFSTTHGETIEDAVKRIFSTKSWKRFRMSVDKWIWPEEWNGMALKQGTNLHIP